MTSIFLHCSQCILQIPSRLLLNLRFCSNRFGESAGHRWATSWPFRKETIRFLCGKNPSTASGRTSRPCKRTALLRPKVLRRAETVHAFHGNPFLEKRRCACLILVLIERWVPYLFDIVVKANALYSSVLVVEDNLTFPVSLALRHSILSLLVHLSVNISFYFPMCEPDLCVGLVAPVIGVGSDCQIQGLEWGRFVQTLGLELNSRIEGFACHLQSQ